MARKNIQGITIEIGGDTTKLQDALKGVEGKLKSTQYALKDVNKLLKLDPGNVELLTQKQQLLSDAIQGTEDKLQTLRDAAKQANRQLADGSMSKAQYDAIQREIIDTEQQLKSLTGQMKEFGSVSAQQIAAAGEKIKSFGDKVTKVGTSLSKHVTAPIMAAGAASVAAFGEVDEGLDIIVAKTGATGEALEDMQQRAKNLATSIPTDFTTAGTAIGEVNTRFDLTGDKLEQLSGKFIKFAKLNNTDVSASIDTVQAAMAAFNLGTEHAGTVLDLLNKAAQETGVDVNKLSGDLTSNAAALREMGFRIDGATGFLARLNKNGLDSSTVLTGMKKTLQNATKDGKNMSQALKELQKSIAGAKSDTEALQIATDLFGAKAAPAMVKAIREGRISFDEMANAVRGTGNSVERTFEETLDPMDSFKTALNEIKLLGADLVETLGPMIKKLAEALKAMFADLRKRWESLSPAAQETIVKLAAIAAAVGPVLIVVGKLAGAVGSIMTLAPKLTGMISTVQGALSGLWGVISANPIAVIIAAVGVLVAAFVYLWNNCEAFREFWINLWNAIKAGVETAWKAITGFLTGAWTSLTGTAEKLFGGLKDKLSGIWDGVKSKAESIWEGITGVVGRAIEKIRDFFSFKWELPKIPLPHFKIEGSFSIAPPRVPRLSVEWYRKAMDAGMILNNPTIFGAANGKLLGGGEAGPEAVIGTDALSRLVASAVEQGMPRAAGTARNLTVILELNGTELGRMLTPLVEAEQQRTGVRLAKI